MADVASRSEGVCSKTVSMRLNKVSERVIRNCVLMVAAAVLLLSSAAGFALQGTPGATPKRLPFVSTIFGDDMVLQRGKTDTIWGWSEPGDKIRVEIAKRSAFGSAGADGRW